MKIIALIAGLVDRYFGVWNYSKVKMEKGDKLKEMRVVIHITAERTE